MTTLSPVKRWLTIAEAVDYSGLSRPTISRMLDARRLRRHDPTGSGRPVLIDRAELDTLIEASAARCLRPAQREPLPAA